MAEPHKSRPNRWTGPPSTWRTYTQEERTVASSLDVIRSQDLSIHLYNAHAIKSRVRATRKRKGKDKGESTGEEENQFVPPDVWTAWPMPADEVPRDPYLPNVGGKTSWRMTENLRPSANLEDALLATTTRTARERWGSRKWEWVARREEGGRKKDEIAEDPVSKQEGLAEDEELPPDRPMFSSQAADAIGNPSSSSSSSGQEEAMIESEEETDAKPRPVPLVDDDRAREILLPSIRHIISKADDLLEGLQKARRAYAGNWNKAKAGDTTMDEYTDTSAEPSRSRARGKIRESSKRARTTSAGSEASINSIASVTSKGRRKPKMKQLKLRDWSDVLGMAALTGWDANVIQRAAERCSSLFSEDMLFRTFEDGGKGQKSDFVEHLASGSKLRDSEDEGSVEVKDEKSVHNAEHTSLPCKSPPVLDSAIRCPVTSCPRHGKVYARANNMYDHVRQRHPEVDIMELKKLESKRRQDQRGKWDRGSRHRSSSAASKSNP